MERITVLPLDAWFSPLSFGLALLATMAVLMMRATSKDRNDYRRFRRVRSSEKRQQYYAKWLRESFLLHGGLSLALVLLCWQAIGPALSAGRSLPPVPLIIETFTQGPSGLAGGLVLGVSIGLVLFLFLPMFFLQSTLREAGGVQGLPSVGDIGPMIPRSRAEIRHGVLLSLNAGLVEELLFRLAVPAVLFGLTGDALASFVLATVLFGLVHVYQKWAGMLAATVIGAAMTLLYLATGSILWPILAHILFDMRSLVLLPWLALRATRTPAAVPAAEPDASTTEAVGRASEDRNIT